MLAGSFLKWNPQSRSTGRAPTRLLSILRICSASRAAQTYSGEGVRWRFARRQRIEIEYFSLNRTGANGFEGEEIEIGDFLLESGAINTTSKASIGRITYGYTVVDGEDSNLVLMGGLHVAIFRRRLA